MRRYRRSLALIHGSLVVVLALAAATAVVALRSTVRQAELATRTDHELTDIEELRGQSVELVRTARAYLLTGNSNDQLRALAIGDELERRAPDVPELTRYVALVASAMEGEEEDIVVRLDRFEQQIGRARQALSEALDEQRAVARARKAAAHTAGAQARLAEVAVVIATLIGIGLTLLAGGLSMRARRRGGDPGREKESTLQPQVDILVLVQGLRAPVARLVAASNRLRASERPRLEQDAVMDVEREAARIDAIVGEVFDTVACGPETLHKEQIDAEELVAQVLAERRGLAAERGIRVGFVRGGGGRVTADPARLRHVMGVLVELAIMESRAGAALVVRVARDTDQVRISIFTDAPTSEGESCEVTQELCRRVIEAHGGAFGIDSQASHRRYWFTLPSEPTTLT